MDRSLRYIVLFVFLVVLQLLVFSNLQFRGTINAFPYLYFIMVLPFATKGTRVLLLSTLIGFLIDFFTGNMGVHMAASVFAGFWRIVLLPMLAPQGNYEEGGFPSVNSCGWKWFMQYVLLMILIHHFCMFMVEGFSFSYIGIALMNTIFCGVLTFLVVIIMEIAFSPK